MTRAYLILIDFVLPLPMTVGIAVLHYVIPERLLARKWCEFC